MTHISKTRFHFADTDRLIDFWHREFREHDLTPHEPEDGIVVAEAGFATVTVRASTQPCEIEIRCEDDAMLPDIRSSIAAHMAELASGLPPLEWSNVGRTGALPPSFTLAEVVSCSSLGASWWRMTLALEPNAEARFDGQHWHFRLLRPQTGGRAPIWPTLNARGTIDWPSGDDELSSRVFTVRRFDPETRLLVFDIFRHPGGPTCDWAASGPVGEAVGIMGPGGNGGPTAPRGGFLVAGGDETAIPAIMRGVEGLPQDTLGHIVMLAGDPADIMELPKGRLDIDWLYRSEGATEADLISAVTAIAPPEGRETELWFAASKKAARTIREHSLQTLGLPKGRFYSIAYWS